MCRLKIVAMLHCRNKCTLKHGQLDTVGSDEITCPLELLDVWNHTPSLLSDNQEISHAYLESHSICKLLSLGRNITSYQN